MTKNTRLALIIVALLLVAALALSACNLTQTPPPGHICRHLCSTCDKCTDTNCNDPECADKCDGHTTTDGSDDSGTTTTPPITDDDDNGDDDDDDGQTTPVAPQITTAFNGVVLHNGASGTVGEMELLSNGYGSLKLSNPASTGYTGEFVNTTITYTVTSAGVFTIWTAPDSNIQTPAVGKIEGRTVSVTVINGINSNATSYEFKSTLNKVTVKNMYGNSETNVCYYPTGHAVDMSATLAGHTFDYALVNNVEKTNSQLATFTVPNEDVTIQYFWTVVAQTGDYTIIYNSGEGTGNDYVDYANSSTYKVLSPYVMSSPSNDVEGEDPEYLMNFTAPTGKYFAGWLIEGTETVVNYNSYITLSADTTTLVAQWASKFTVTLVGLGGGNITGVETNLGTLGWQGSNAEGFTQDYTPSSKFYLPGETAQWNGMVHVSRSGFILLGWQCSEHGVMHEPGFEHMLTQDVTFTAVWQRDDGTSPLDGTYNATVAIDLSDWGFGVIVRAEIANRKLTLYDVSGEDTKVFNLSTGTTTVTGTDGSLWSCTLTLEGDTLTITIKAALKTIVGTFVRAI